MLTDEQIVTINEQHYNLAYRDYDKDIAVAKAIESAVRAEMASEIEALKHKVAELEKDAGRYRWLCGFSSVSMPELTWGRRAGIPKNKLDAAIDAAIKDQT
ncbi:MAG: hypothetical protein ACKO0Z_21940 [Betaproteobacteria bacterium]